MRPPSIQRTLLLRCGLGVGLLLCLLSIGVYLLVNHSFNREIDRALAQTAAMLENQVELENDKVTFEWEEGLASSDAMVLEGLFQFWDEQTGETARSPALRSGDLAKFEGENGKPVVKEILLPNGDRGRALGLRIHPFTLPEEMERMKSRGKVIDPKSLNYTLVVARDIEPMQHTLKRLRYMLAAGNLLTIALVFTLINRVIRSSLKPIIELKRQIDERAEHQLDTGLTLPRELPVELSGMAENFDALLTRVAALRIRERDFIRHTAHELRTPIAGLRATTDLALSQPRDAAAYLAHLASCQRTAVELGELVKRLSALSRIGQAGSPPLRELVDLGATLADCLAPLRPLFEARTLRISQNFPAEGMIARGDVTLVQIVFNNLLDNALSYSPFGGEIRMTGELTGGQVEIRIANRADDLPDNLERLFEPLFRKESSRNDGASHLGIGLTLSLEAATASGGTLLARKPEDGWIELVFRMPAA